MKRSIQTDRTFNVTIKYGSFPDSVDGLVSSNDSDDYTIWINENKPEETKTEAFLHEMLHIYHDDLHSDISASEIESERHKELAQLLSSMEEGGKTWRA